MKIAIYYSDKKRERELGPALRAGFEKHGDSVDLLPTADYLAPADEYQLAVMVGVKGRSKEIFEGYRRSGRHTLLVDKGYFGRGEYMRLSLDGFQPHYAHAVARPHDRFEKLGVELKPLRSKGAHVIYAGSSQKYCDWHDLGDATEFANGVCHTIRKRTGRVVHYRPKPSWAAGHPEAVTPIEHTIFSGPNESFQRLLKGCHALVTHGSNAAIEAIASGVPAVLVSREGACAAWPLADKSFPRGLDAPFWPSDERRRQVFADLAYCQFTLGELASGFAWETLLPHTIKRFGGTPTAADLYRIMHENPRNFRGISLKNHIDAVQTLVARHNPKSLLDYGSGKGRQYDELALHERWGWLKPVCYDPGYEPFAQKPSGKFHGVICTDVAEHIDEPEVPAFLADVIGYATRFVFFCIFTNHARKRLPDGRNCHLTVRPAEWWIEQICRACGGERTGYLEVEKELPDGTRGRFPHHVIVTPQGVEVVATFRGDD